MEPEPAQKADVKSERLPAQLGAQLTPRTRDALSHPVRRQILRALNDSADPRSPSELATMALPQASLSVIGYHVHVLASCGSIALAATRPTQDGIEALYASTVAGDEQVVSVLQATRQIDHWDEELR
jgi:DNA-binding transcriptional ArsR family regulator